ncbi:uncharacterized protein LOC114575526 [Exaiptasia diaphana]|uniref:Tc1-like transposase DDE domain-containing protein n=1 Tax=Exaiptasia diaphana TaxID=2652724 RepID=A0A913YMS5_EXADI|nr:uncharacterized protein LOC114575526 [Exaiptasia diaphana]
MGYSRRKLNLIARQRNDWLRAEFRHRMAQFDTHQLLFIDESSKDERTFQRRYARGLKGSRISTKGNFTRGTRYSVLSAISVEGVIASHTIVGAYDQRQFEFAMTSFVLPHVGSVARREKCSVVIMDNCAIHTSNDVITALTDQQCKGFFEDCGYF